MEPGYNVITLKNWPDGSETDICTDSDLCYNPNGSMSINACQCDIENCVACSRADSSGTCYQCGQGFSFDESSNSCIATSSSGSLELEYFVKSFDGLFMDSATLSE